MSIYLPFLACSGSGAVMQMERSYAVGYWCAGIGAFITIVLAYDSWRSRRFTIPLIAALLLLAIHPAWTVAVMHGDCSTPRIPASYAATGAFAVLVFIQYALSKRAA